MLLAELFGKARHEFQNDEDMLTSTVFGILRYLPASVFWVDFLKKARSSDGVSFVDRCRSLGADLKDSTKVDVFPWQKREGLGEPDLIVVVSGHQGPPLCFLIEAKLWSGKSSAGQDDQLVRYLEILNDYRWLEKVTRTRGPLVRPGLVYLCAQAAWPDIRESIRCAEDRSTAEQSLFLVQWQDLLSVAREAARGSVFPSSLVLRDVTDFLEHRGLGYFHGFSSHTIPGTLPEKAAFCGENNDFHGFKQHTVPMTLPGRAVFYGGQVNEAD